MHTSPPPKTFFWAGHICTIGSRRRHGEARQGAPTIDGAVAMTHLRTSRRPEHRRRCQCTSAASRTCRCNSRHWSNSPCHSSTPKGHAQFLQIHSTRRTCRSCLEGSCHQGLSLSLSLGLCLSLCPAPSRALIRCFVRLFDCRRCRRCCRCFHPHRIARRQGFRRSTKTPSCALGRQRSSSRPTECQG